MKRYRKKSMTAMQVCLIALLTLLIGRSARAQLWGAEPANCDHRERLAAAAKLSLAPRGPEAEHGAAHDIVGRDDSDRTLLRALNEAWRMCGDGMSSRESALLIYRMKNGTYVGRLQGFTNEQYQLTFPWDPAAVAIVHTHPNRSEPRPADQDRRIAEKYGVPNFTITISGMYVYDPATKKTTKVLNGLDWLEPSTYQNGLMRWLGKTQGRTTRFDDACACLPAF